MTDNILVKAVLLQKRPEAEGIYTFIFKPEFDLSFKPGQFAFWEFEREGKKFSKPFSFANSPTRPNLEFTTIISDSEYKQYLDKFNIQDEIIIRGPFGNFTLDNIGKENICFLVGGIGITPVRSILQYAVDKELKFEFSLIFSNRYKARVIFMEELESIACNVDKCSVIHSLSQPTEEDIKEWKGETGHINARLIKKHVINYENTHFMIVGPPMFIETMDSILMNELGIESDCITKENFAGY